MGSVEDALDTDESATAEILVERVNERHLSAPLSRISVLASYQRVSRNMATGSANRHSNVDIRNLECES